MIDNELVEIHSLEPKVFQLTWCINNICTNHCRYCPSLLHRGSNHHYDWSHAERFARILMERHPHMQVVFAGGEPTVSPWLKDLINLFLDRGHHVGLTTNGIRRGSYWDDCRPDYVCVSYHAEFSDDDWILRCLETQRRIPHVTARIMMDPDRWDQCVRVYEIMTRMSVGVEAVPIVYWGADTERVVYSPEQQQWLQSQTMKLPLPSSRVKPEHLAEAEYLGGRRELTRNFWSTRLIARDQHHFTGWQCDIGLESLFVHFDGSYRRGNCAEGGYLGRIQDTRLIWPTEPVICGQSQCHCTTDIETAKRMIPIRPHPVNRAAKPLAA